MSETTVRNGEWVTVIIAARNEASRIGSVISAVLKQAVHDQAVEVLVADDGSSDGTAGEARKAGARVVELPKSPGNPGAARNHGAQEARGGILIFLDADCLPQPGWLTAHLAEQDRGHPIVGGSLAIPSGLSWTARADYYVSSYHVHPDRRAGVVPGHTPANLSVRREVFAATSGFAVELPVADGHEELGWQSEAGRRGVPVYFQPRAIVQHFNRPGLGNLLRRSYRWGYSALEAKTSSGTSRAAGLYRHPLLALVAAYPLALMETGYILSAWLAAGRWEAVQFLPVMLLSRLVYATAFIIGGWRWLGRNTGERGVRPQWR